MPGFESGERTSVDLMDQWGTGTAESGSISRPPQYRRRNESELGGVGGPNGRSGTGRGNGSGSQGRGGRQKTPTTAELNTPRGATTIDRLFHAVVKVETRGRAWTWNKANKELTSHNLRLGISDGQTTQLIEGDLSEGAEVITNIITAASVRPGFNPQQGNPFFQGPGDGRGQGGNRGGFRSGGRGF